MFIEPKILAPSLIASESETLSEINKLVIELPNFTEVPATGSEISIARRFLLDPNKNVLELVSKEYSAYDVSRRNILDCTSRPPLEVAIKSVEERSCKVFFDFFNEVNRSSLLGHGVPIIRTSGMQSSLSGAGIYTKFPLFETKECLIKTLLHNTTYPPKNLSEVLANFINILSIHPFTDGNGRFARLIFIRQLSSLYNKNIYIPMNFLCHLLSRNFLYATRLIGIESPRAVRAFLNYFRVLISCSGQLVMDLNTT